MKKSIVLWLMVQTSLVVLPSAALAADSSSEDVDQTMQAWQFRQQDHERRIAELEDELKKEKTQREDLSKKMEESKKWNG